MYITFTTIAINVHIIDNFLWILHIASSIQMTLLEHRRHLFLMEGTKGWHATFDQHIFVPHSDFVCLKDREKFASVIWSIDGDFALIHSFEHISIIILGSNMLTQWYPQYGPQRCYWFL